MQAQSEANYLQCSLNADSPARLVCSNHRSQNETSKSFRTVRKLKPLVGQKPDLLTPQTPAMWQGICITNGKSLRMAHKFQENTGSMTAIRMNQPCWAIRWNPF